MLAGRRIFNLNFGKRDDPVLDGLRRFRCAQRPIRPTCKRSLFSLQRAFQTLPDRPSPPALPGVITEAEHLLFAGGPCETLYGPKTRHQSP